ncbi:MAG: aspartate kinase, partial [Lachnospiraceae bacterium]|nr:aspartate kinase [Lachnospiraceae bacterium]
MAEKVEEKAIVAKFGGSSLADAGQFRKVKEIIESDPRRRYIVVSAPGKRVNKGKEESRTEIAGGDEKVTDLLYKCYENASGGEDYKALLDQIRNRYQEIIDELGLEISLERDFDKIETAFLGGAGEEYAASRGEYLNAKLVSAYLNYPFVDTAEVIRFDRDGNFKSGRTNFFLREKLEKLPHAVIPGFYGADDAGNIHTFSRGGSDVTGALVARAVLAQLYENWTDVPGFLLADPGIVPNPVKIDAMTFAELRELAYRGAAVL